MMCPTRRSPRTAPASSTTRTEHPATGGPTSINSTAPSPGSASTTTPPLNAARSRTSGAATSPGGGKVTASVASARPYTGRAAAGSSPAGRVLAAKARHTVGAIGSAPTRRTRTADRSSRARTSSGTRRTASARAKLAAESTVPRCRAATSNHRRGRLANDMGPTLTCRARAASGARCVPMSPMSWKYGIQLTTTSSAHRADASRIWRRLASTAPCVTSTPLGAPVLPDENCRNATSSGPAATGSRTAGPSRRASRARTRTPEGKPSASEAVAASTTTGGRPRCSQTGSARRVSGASGTGTSPAATAPQNMGWKSSLRSANNGTHVPRATPASRKPPATSRASSSSSLRVTVSSLPSPRTWTTVCPGASRTASSSTSRRVMGRSTGSVGPLLGE